MAGEDVVFASTSHVGEKAAMMHAEALHHAHSSPGIKHAHSSQLGGGLVAAQGCNARLKAFITPIWQHHMFNVSNMTMSMHRQHRCCMSKAHAFCP